ncbi:DUF5342 family protein [Priestia sp. SIMBA_032]|uniref:DUF5342 family protein n=1 Tax=Priestia sp. SIMBA_032 TaxID=3085775 RepID=UPI003979E907
MFKQFKIKSLFEGQFHQRYHLTMRLLNSDYQAIYFKGQIQWLNPLPRNDFPQKEFGTIEANVHKLMSYYQG